ncbi:hypothetical protein B0H14DRAFT_2625418 [Mycena olivaceomarginata]|nr:hypothetical protein B0H14DRAFT_2625418 [Mycena olivaceomarginata]
MVRRYGSLDSCCIICGSNIITEFWNYIEYSTRSVKFIWWYALYCTKQARLWRPLQDTCWDDSRGDLILRQAKDYRQRCKATNQERIARWCHAVYHTERIIKPRTRDEPYRGIVVGRAEDARKKKREEPQLRSSGDARGCKELEKHTRVLDRKVDHKRDRRVASGSARSGRDRSGDGADARDGAGSTVFSADAREDLGWADYELVARWAEGQTCELVRVNDDRGEAIDGQGGRRHIKIGPGAGENGRKENETRPTRGTQELAQEWVDR